LIQNPQNQVPGTLEDGQRFVLSALDAMAAHIAILNTNGEIIAVNKAWRDFADSNGFKDTTYGVGTNYLAVCDASAALRSKDAPLVAQGIRDVAAKQMEDFELEYPCHSPTSKRWFVVRVSRFEWEDDVRLIVAHQNVSELRQAHIDLATSQERIKAILDNVNNGIITINLRGVIETSNQAAARIFRCQTDDLLGSHITEWLQITFNGRSTFKQLNGGGEHELTANRRDGETFPVQISMNELRLDDGTFYTCIIQDITFRKQMEAEMLEKETMAVALEKERELRELKNRFLSMMSHELRTPLASIRLSYDMLKQYAEMATEEEKEQYLDNIQTQVEHLLDMVTDVITLSKSETESLGFIPEDADLITYCRNVVEEFQLTYHKTHQIEFECDETTIIAPIDRRLMRRVLTNLLSNAIKYSLDGGRIWFYLDVDGTQAKIRVKDSGIGIPLEDQDRLFEPFHRAGNVDNVTGTGLGLAITKQAIEAHSGSISFSSEENRGTTFIITLPLSASDPHLN